VAKSVALMIAIGNILMEFSPFLAHTANALKLRRLPVVATTMSYRTCAMVEPSAYNGEARLSPSPPARPLTVHQRERAGADVSRVVAKL
jgi:hypothetical protein